MWARDFVGTKSTFSPHSINIIPTFYQQCTHPHKFSINYQLFSNVFPTNSPLLNNFSTFLPLQNQHSPHSPIFCQCSSSLWGDCGDYCGDYVDMGENWGKCWYIYFPYSPSKWLNHCGEDVGNMLMWAKRGESGEENLFYWERIVVERKACHWRWKPCNKGKIVAEKILL